MPSGSRQLLQSWGELVLTFRLFSDCITMLSGNRLCSSCFETASRLLSGLLSACSPNSVQQWLQTSLKRKKKKSLTCPFNLARRISVVLRYGSGLSHSLYNSREVGQRAADSIAASFSSPFLRDSALPKLAWGRIATTALPGGGHFSCACAAGTQPPDKLDSQVCPTHLVCNVLLCCGFS